MFITFGPESLSEDIELGFNRRLGFGLGGVLVSNVLHEHRTKS
jgi:hypothetical protein